MAVRAAPTRRSTLPKEGKLDLIDIIAQLRENLGAHLLALMVKRHARTVDRWLTDPDRSIDFETERRLRAAFQVYQEILTVEAPPTIRAWFIGMNPQLEDRSPAEAIADNDLKAVMAAARSFTRAG